MKIEEAIQILQDAQEQGTKSIVFAYWDSKMFDREDDETWENLTDLMEEEMDWSNTHDTLRYIMDLELER